MRRNLILIAVLSACSPDPVHAPVAETVDAQQQHSNDAMRIADATPQGEPSIPTDGTVMELSAQCEEFHDYPSGDGVTRYYAATFPFPLGYGITGIPLIHAWVCGYNYNPPNPNAPPFPACLSRGFYFDSGSILVNCGIATSRPDGTFTSYRAETAYLKIYP